MSPRNLSTQPPRWRIATAFAAIFLGWAFASEPLTARTLLAAAVIVAAVVIITTYRARGGNQTMPARNERRVLAKPRTKFRSRAVTQLLSDDVRH